MNFRRLPSGLWLPSTAVPFLGMAGNLVQVGSSDGKVRVKSNGPVVAGASDPCCCSSSVPCTDCNGTQNSVSVTISGSCAALCSGAAGTYAWGSFTTAGSPVKSCRWQWTQGSFFFNIQFCLATALFLSNIGHSSPNGIPFGDGTSVCTGTASGTDVTSSVICSGGLLTATFTLPGMNQGTFANCIGCTAAITL